MFRNNELQKLLKQKDKIDKKIKKLQTKELEEFLIKKIRWEKLKNEVKIRICIS